MSKPLAGVHAASASRTVSESASMARKPRLNWRDARQKKTMGGVQARTGTANGSVDATTVLSLLSR